MALGSASEIFKCANHMVNRILPAKIPEIEKKKPDPSANQGKVKLFPSFYDLIEHFAPYVELSREETTYSFDKMTELCAAQGSTVTCYYLIPNKSEVLYGEMSGGIYRLNIDSKKITQEHKPAPPPASSHPIRILALTRNDSHLSFVQDDEYKVKELGKPTQQPVNKLPLKGRKICVNLEEKVIFLSDQNNEYLKYSINEEGKDYLSLGKLEVPADSKLSQTDFWLDDFLKCLEKQQTLSLDALTQVLQNETSEIIAMRANNKELVVLKLEGTRYFLYNFSLEKNVFEHKIEVVGSACLEKTVYRCLAVPKDSRNEEFIAVAGNTWDTLEDGTLCSLGLLQVFRINLGNTSGYSEYGTSAIRPSKQPNQSIQKIDFLHKQSNGSGSHILVVFDKCLTLVRFQQKQFQVVAKSDFQMNPEYSYLLNHAKNEILTTNCQNKFVVINLVGHR